MIKIVFILFSILNLYALNCSSIGDVKKYNGHYYVTTIHPLTFNQAKEFAENNGGYLAIPNSDNENNFIRNLVPSGKYGWIGVYDPDYTTNYCYGNDDCAYDTNRFVDIKGEPLIYSNWAENQPDNLVKSYDVYKGVQRVSPLGEHWVAISSLNGKWADFGNHYDEYNNPVKFFAVIEFDKMPDCYTPPSDVNDTYEGAKCNTKIWDDKTGTLSNGQTYNCLKDKHGVEYCPAALAECGADWEYKDGYAVKHSGIVKDYTKKIAEYITVTKTGYIGCSDVNKRGISLLCKNSWRWSCWSGYRKPNGACGDYFCPDPTKMDPNGKICWGPNGEFCSNIRSVFGNGKGWIFIGACSDNDRCCYYSNKGRLGSWAVINPISANQTYKYQTTETRYICPSGYSDNVNNCVRDVSYSYYQYLCSGKNYYGETYYPIDKGYTTYTKTDSDTSSENPELADNVNSPTPPPNNCRAKKFVCNPAPDRKCVEVDNKWQCSPYPCFGAGDGDYNITNTDTPVGVNDAKNDGWNSDGSCGGTLYIFNGKDSRCRSSDVFFGLTGGGCCNKDKVALGLIKCKEDEKILAKRRKNGKCHYIGEYCSKELKLLATKICIQHKDTYCCFNSKLARIINEQGRPQINKDWGSANSPNCRGFTPEEFSKLDFSKIDLSEFYNSISNKVSSSLRDDMSKYIKISVTNQLDQFQK